MLKGKSTPIPNIGDVVERYSMISQLDLNIIHDLSSKLYKLKSEISYPYYVRIALQTPSPIELLYISVNETNVDYYLYKYGIIIPSVQLPDRVKLFRDNIIEYSDVFNRDSNVKLLSPLELFNNSHDNNRTILQKFTNIELYNKYHEVFQLTESSNRNDLIHDITFKVNSISWKVNRKTKCGNNVNGDDIVSFGTNSYYICYNFSDLENSFHRQGDDYIFTNPYALETSKLGVIGEEFTLKEIIKLRDLMINIKRTDTLLFDFIYNGILYKTGTRTVYQVIEDQIKEYETLDVYSKEQITQFLVWLFFYSMYMLSWRGPGNPYPTYRIYNNKNIPLPLEEPIMTHQKMCDILMSSYTDDAINFINNIIEVDYPSMLFGTKFTEENLVQRLR